MAATSTAETAASPLGPKVPFGPATVPGRASFAPAPAPLGARRWSEEAPGPRARDEDGHVHDHGADGNTPGVRAGRRTARSRRNGGAGRCRRRRRLLRGSDLNGYRSGPRRAATGDRNGHAGIPRLRRGRRGRRGAAGRAGAGAARRYCARATDPRTLAPSGDPGPGLRDVRRPVVRDSGRRGDQCAPGQARLRDPGRPRPGVLRRHLPVDRRREAVRLVPPLEERGGRRPRARFRIHSLGRPRPRRRPGPARIRGLALRRSRSRAQRRPGDGLRLVRRRRRPRRRFLPQHPARRPQRQDRRSGSLHGRGRGDRGGSHGPAHPGGRRGGRHRPCRRGQRLAVGAIRRPRVDAGAPRPAHLRHGGPAHPTQPHRTASERP